MSVNGPSEILTENCELLTESKEIPVQTAEDFNKEMAENANPIQIIEDDKEWSKCNKENIKMNKNLKKREQKKKTYHNKKIKLKVDVNVPTSPVLKPIKCDDIQISPLNLNGIS